MQGQSACALVTIPGFTHPVQDLFLEDVLERTGFTIGRGSKCVPEMFDGLFKLLFLIQALWRRVCA